MINQNGIGFIVWETGWACSDDVVFDVERDPIPDGEGKINLVETNTLKYLSIFEQPQGIVKGLKVDCIFKSGEDKYAFTGMIRGKAGDLTIVDLHKKSSRINEIIAKIKSFKP